MYGVGNSFISEDLQALLAASGSGRWLVTGGAGFIGSHIAECLLENGREVVILDNLSTGQRANIEFLKKAFPEGLDFIEGDIRDSEILSKAMNGVSFVLHQAGLGSVPRSIVNPMASHESNVIGFLNVMSHAVQKKIARVVYASSSSVYGDSPVLPKKEQITGAPLSPYAATKAIDEVYAATFALGFGLTTIGLRYFNVFGPRQNPNGPYAAVIPRWIDDLRNNRAPTINGDGTTSRDFCFVANAVEANLRAALTPSIAGFHFCNIACGEQIDLTSLAGILREEVGQALAFDPPEPKYGPFRAGDVRHSLADVSKAKELFGYEPRTRAIDGLRYTAKAELGRQR